MSVRDRLKTKIKSRVIDINLLFFNNISNTGHYWETDWIKLIFKTDNKFNIKINQEIDKEKIYENPIIVTSDPDDDYIKKYIEKDLDFCIIHLSDEAYIHNISIYNEPKCKFIFRNYYSTYFTNFSHKILNFDLGYKQGLWDNYFGLNPDKIKIGSRKYKWSFCGNINKSDRSAYISDISDIKPHFIHKIMGWNTPDSLSAQEYRNIMLNTIFVPCLIGNVNVDTFRLYEALECGCIPIIFKYQRKFGKHGCKDMTNYYEKLFGNHPIITVTNWFDIKEIMENFLENEYKLEKKRLEIYRWWKNRIFDTQNSVNKILCKFF